MAIFLRGRGFRFSRLQAQAPLFKFPMSNRTLTEGGMQSQLYPEMDTDSVITPIDTSKWRKIDARVFGIKSSMIPASSWTVMNILKRKGFQSYLVGGCVRDLMLHRAPKDFDVITTADLKQIRKQFNRAQIVGKRFPICQVWIKGSVIEVSSFNTMAHHSEKKEEKEKEISCQIPYGCDEKDFNRWRNSLQRDFTINSLFMDPFGFKIYDYANGMADLKSLKLRTLIPAVVSFKEDCARILRGLRIAARLDLSFSKDIEAAIHGCAASVESLDRFRLMMEMNYMLSYGAAGPSILLLRRFNLLRMLLPFQAAYLEEAHKASAESSPMLMQLFLHMDELVFCDQPADCRLWIALLAFHIALVHHPQDALVIRAFASVLYQGSWTEAIKFAREEAKWLVKFAPEISESSKIRSDEELAEEVARFAYLIQDSLCVLTVTENLLKSRSRYPDFQFSGLVFVPKKKARDAAEIFDDLVNEIESYENRRESFAIDYLMLGKGDPHEVRFVLGKIILETMRDNIVGQNGLIFKKEKRKMPKLPKENDQLNLNDMLKNHQTSDEKDRKRGFGESISEPKQKLSKWQKQIVREGVEDLDSTCLKVVKKVKPLVSVDKVFSKDHMVKQERLVEEKDCNIASQEEIFGGKTKKRKKSSKLQLSSLFK